MTRQLLGVLALGAILGCATDAKPRSSERTTIVPAPGIIGADFSRDGRLAYARFVAGKSAFFVSNADGSNAKRVSFGVWDYGIPCWSPDGKWIAFQRDLGGADDAIIVPADSGAERAVAATPADEEPTGWLADGSGLLFTRSAPSGTSLWLYKVADGSSAKVFEVDGSVTGYPSPDGKLIGYQLTKGGKRTVWTYDLAAKTHKQLTTEGSEGLAPRPFSPDSKSLVYESRRTGTSDLWRVDVASGERRQLTQDIADDVLGMWSPDGTRIAFRSTRGGQPDIWVLSAGESDVQRVTDDAAFDAAVQWSPDGKSLIAAVDLGHRHLYSLPVAGAPAVALTSGEWDVGRSGTASNTEVSRDGRVIAYAGSKNGDPDIWAISASGGEARLVAGGASTEADPTWSPDTMRIAFTSTRSGNPDIWVAPASGGPPVQLTKWPGFEGVAKWSPAGGEIAFASDHESPGTDLWVVPAAGGAPRRLTTIGTMQADERWSPDGKWLAYTARTAGTGGPAVFVVPAAGGAARQVSPSPSFTPDWSRDGKELRLSMCRAGYCSTEVWSVAGAHLRTLSTDSAVYEFGGEWSPDGTMVAISHQDLLVDGGDRVHLRQSAGGAARVLAGPAGFTMDPVGFSAGGTNVIALGAPNGNALQRIAVPPALKTP